MSDSVVTRFAPSPTGYLHVGGARTALFSWLYARHHGGRFLVRVEDTDEGRNQPELITPILDGLEALGLVGDSLTDRSASAPGGIEVPAAWEGRVAFQSARGAAYAEATEKLLASGDAYRCWCTPAELRERREAAMAAGTYRGYDRTCRERRPPPGDPPAVVRLKAPLAGEVAFHDAIKGDLVFQGGDLEDFVLARSDGTPIFHLAVVVDDAWMGVTHVLRGDDHVKNTPKQILLQRALGLPVPAYGHVPMILGPDKKRLSKRHGATSVTAYLHEEGYLPEALRNYLVRLGWSHGDQEIFTPGEMIEAFDLDGCGSAAAVFDPEKLGWLSGHYVREREATALAREWASYLGLPERGEQRLEVEVDAWFERVTAAFQPRARTLAEMTELARPFLVDDEALVLPDRGDKPVRKWLGDDGIAAMAATLETIDAIEPFEGPEIEDALRAIAEAGHDGKMGKVAQPVRVGVTGLAKGPPIDETLVLLGRDRTRRRLRRALDHYRADGASGDG